MTQSRKHIGGVLAVAFGALTATPARAASLQAVSNWNGGVSGLPSDVSMYIYVPDKVATNPPILTLIHYCGGTASAVFGQASGGGIVKAADQYGFIMVVPSSGRCWDVVSSKTRTRDGGGDTHAIVQMVRYAVTKYQANADRVYATGDSSGGMTTQLLLGLYPDIFKAGSSMAGMPAGCGTTTATAGGYDGACAGGTVTHTPQEWGDIVRKMDPSYTGHRARVQLFHGDADTTIRYANFNESIKEWSNVLGLSTTPTSTQSGLTLGTHQATRQSWKNACGYTVLDGFTSAGGDHGPSDALFLSQYVIPFLGLDKTGAVDPEIAQCGAGGAGGAGGASGVGGASTNGGTTANAGGRTSTGGTATTLGGAPATGGRSSIGGASATAGNSAGGATSASGGRTATGGSVANGGTSAIGGSPVGGSNSALGGSSSSTVTVAGGRLGNGGSNPSPIGGSVVTANGGGYVNGGAGVGGSAPAVSGTSAGSANGPDNSGCSCSVRTKSSPSALIGLALGSMLILQRRRKQ